ncbi:hypothetical protein J3E68DRAFT_445176 [Trichoderma sp. SZMC 28012]
MSDLLTTTTSAFSARWDDEGSGATREGGFWHPDSQGDLRPLGSVGVSHYDDINGRHLVKLIGPGSSSASSGLPLLASPTGYTQLWNGEDSGASKDGAFWRPIPPNGYVALGDVVTAGLNPPATSDIWCVRQDIVRQASFDSNSIWDSEESGAKSDVSIWEVLSVRRSDFESESGNGIFLGAFRANHTYNAPDSIFAQVPFVWDFASAQPSST